MDTSKIGHLAAAYMEKFDDEEVRDDVEPDSIRLGELIIVGEVRWRDKDGQEQISVTTASTTDNRIHQSGILQWGQDVVFDGDSEIGDLNTGSEDDDS